jgi:hypothetical protein
MHGYAITTHIRRTSADLLRVEEGPFIRPFTAWSSRDF